MGGGDDGGLLVQEDTTRPGPHRQYDAIGTQVCTRGQSYSQQCVHGVNAYGLHCNNLFHGVLLVVYFMISARIIVLICSLSLMCLFYSHQMSSQQSGLVLFCCIDMLNCKTACFHLFISFYVWVSVEFHCIY